MLEVSKNASRTQARKVAILKHRIICCTLGDSKKRTPQKANSMGSRYGPTLSQKGGVIRISQWRSRIRSVSTPNELNAGRRPSTWGKVYSRADAGAGAEPPNTREPKSEPSLAA